MVPLTKKMQHENKKTPKNQQRKQKKQPQHQIQKLHSNNTKPIQTRPKIRRTMQQYHLTNKTKNNDKTRVHQRTS